MYFESGTDHWLRAYTKNTQAQEFKNGWLQHPPIFCYVLLKFSCFFLFSSFLLENVEKEFNQRVECAATKCWSKYTAYTIGSSQKQLEVQKSSPRYLCNFIVLYFVVYFDQCSSGAAPGMLVKINQKRSRMWRFF